MLFVEPRFFLFFVIVLAVYWSLRTNDLRKMLHPVRQLLLLRLLGLPLRDHALRHLRRRLVLRPAH